MSNQNECIQPDVIREGDLLAYIDNAASPAVVAHVQRCLYCAAQVERLRSTEQALVSSFYREDCPGPRELALFWEGKLKGRQLSEVKAHVDACPYCQEELAVYMANASQPATHEKDRLVEFIQETITGARSIIEAVGVFPFGQAFGQPPAFAFSAVRGGSPSAKSSQFYRAGSLDIVIGFSASEGGTAGALLGTVMQAEQVSGQPAWLFQAGAAPVKSQVDTMGVFSFEQVTPGLYDLVLEMGDQAVVVRGMRVVR